MDGQTAVVGVASRYGEAPVFTRDPIGRRMLETSLVPVDATVNDFFGISVAMSGDSVLIGAPGRWIGEQQIPGRHRIGSAYVFTRDESGSWSQQAKLLAPDGALTFGKVVALDGDTAIVGAPSEWLASRIRGAAYVYVRRNGLWTRTAKLTAADAAWTQSGYFGYSVALDGDLVLVGAPGAAGSAGVAYLYALSPNPLLDNLIDSVLGMDLEHGVQTL